MIISPSLVLGAAVVNFVLGAFWYSPLLFGKSWLKIMEKTQLSKEELQTMQKTMGPFYLLQFLITVVLTGALDKLFFYLPDMGHYRIALWMWLGFIVPTQIACVIWGNTKKEFWFKQLSIMVTYQLIAILVSTFILSLK